MCMYIKMEETHHAFCFINRDMCCLSDPFLGTAVVKSSHNTYRVKFIFKIHSGTLISYKILIISHYLGPIQVWSSITSFICHLTWNRGLTEERKSHLCHVLDMHYEDCLQSKIFFFLWIIYIYNFFGLFYESDLE